MLGRQALWQEDAVDIGISKEFWIGAACIVGVVAAPFLGAWFRKSIERSVDKSELSEKELYCFRSKQGGHFNKMRPHSLG
jgi:hypothetical protein